MLTDLGDLGGSGGFELRTVSIAFKSPLLCRSTLKSIYILLIEIHTSSSSVLRRDDEYAVLLRLHETWQSAVPQTEGEYWVSVAERLQYKQSSLPQERAPLSPEHLSRRSTKFHHYAPCPADHRDHTAQDTRPISAAIIPRRTCSSRIQGQITVCCSWRAPLSCACGTTGNAPRRSSSLISPRSSRVLRMDMP